MEMPHLGNRHPLESITTMSGTSCYLRGRTRSVSVATTVGSFSLFESVGVTNRISLTA